MTLIEKLKARARTRLQRIVLPEGEDPRVVSAAATIIRESFAKVTLLGRKQIIESVAANLGVSLQGITVIEPSASPKIDAYEEMYYERRRAQGASLEESREMARRPSTSQLWQWQPVTPTDPWAAQPTPRVKPCVQHFTR